MSKIPVLIVDDHAGFKRIVTNFLSTDERFEIVGEASNSVEGLALACALQPQVVLLDIRMPGMNGLTIIDKMRENVPNLIIVVLTLWDTPEYRQAALATNKADAYVIKENLVTDLMPALDKLLDETIPQQAAA